MRNPVRKAFTLVEILIVVVILGILAAIVIPQFTNASQEAQRGNVVTQMQTIRNQIELYRVRNNGTNPTLAGTGNAAFSAAGASLVNPPANPTQQPYMRSPALNPRNSRTDVADVTTTGDAFIADAAGRNPTTAGQPGWIYNPTTGEFCATGYSEFSNTWFGEPNHLTARP